MGSLTRLGYSMYQRSPLHPHLGGLIKRSLRLRNRFVARDPFIHDLGPFRMHIDLSQLIDTSIYSMGTWEEKSIVTLRHLLPPGGTAVDIGAHIGFMTFHMAEQVGQQGRVIAFEPSTWSFERLQANAELNDQPQVRLERLGLSHRQEVLEDVLVPYSYPLVGERPWGRDTVSLCPLDEYFKQNPIERLDLLKCDTDGWEVEVFEGASETLSKFCPDILFEINPRGLSERNQSMNRLIELVSDLGYTLHHEVSLAPYSNLDAMAAQVSKTNLDWSVVALHPERRTKTRTPPVPRS